MSGRAGVPGRRRGRGRRVDGWTWPSRLFLSGQAVSLAGDGLAALAIPLLVLDLTRNPLVSGLSAATVTVGYLLVGLPAGVLVDRLNPWRMLIAMDAARAVLFALLYALWVAGVLRVWLILTLGLSAGACSVFSESALTVVVKDRFAVSGLMAANSALELASQLSLIAGPAVGGLRAAAGGISLALPADALTFAVSLASLVTVAGRGPVAPGSRRHRGGSGRGRLGRRPARRGRSPKAGKPAARLSRDEEDQARTDRDEAGGPGYRDWPDRRTEQTWAN